jgi:putative oxygen-independent coproporphyrinogen III oxidase
VIRPAAAANGLAAPGSAAPSGEPRPIGIYLHFPWCVRKCPYCDFASFEPDGGPSRIPHHDYAEAVIAELEHRAEALADRHVETVFVGGGTPSLWDPAALGKVLQAIASVATSVASDVETTVECNPNSFDSERAQALADVGVNRVSIGVQGLDPTRLGFLGRLHDPDEALRAVEAALASPVPRVSADLMYGVASSASRFQSPEQAASEADRVAALGVEHLSAYSLTIEPNTRFGELDRRGSLPKVEDEVMARAFAAIGEVLSRRGLRRYEISNYSQPGAESRHNLGYWRGRDYLGLGVAAYGTLTEGADAVRYRNAPNPARYLDSVGRGDFTPHEREVLSPETRLCERIMLGLRLVDGFDLQGAAAELGIEPWTASRTRAAERLVEAGRLIVDAGRLSIPAAGWMFVDGTAAALF